MKKYITRTAAVCLMAALAVTSFAACGKQSDTIKIGINYELSGDVAQYGKASVNGIKLAIDEINAAGGVKGKQIELVEYDNQSKTEEATTLTQKLISKDKVLAVLGPATSGAFKATIPAAISGKVPVISGSATADDVTVDANGVKEYAFRICFNDSFQGTAMAVFASKNLNAKTAAILADSSSDYAKGLKENFTKKFEALGGSIVATESYVTNDTDFNSVLTKMKNKSFDVLFVPGYYNEAGLIIKQAREMGIKAAILGCDGFDSTTLKDLAGEANLTNVYYSNHYSPLDQDEAVLSFISAYKKKMNADPGAFEALGYDLAKFTVDAISRADELTGESVKAAMAATKDFKGVTGTLSVDANHNPVKNIVVIGLENGVAKTSVKVDMG